MCFSVLYFFFNDTATTEIYTLSLHDALPISLRRRCTPKRPRINTLSDSTSCQSNLYPRICRALANRSEEHTSELQSRQYLVCRLLLEKKKKNTKNSTNLHIRNTSNRVPTQSL